jgi:hypothetical protein
MALISDAQAGIAPMTLFCPVPGCLREPYHHGDHAPVITVHEDGTADGDPNGTADDATTSVAAEEPNTKGEGGSDE